MGLDDFTTNATTESLYKSYNLEELDERLEEIVENHQDRFPYEVRVDFIEASPELKSHAGKAYYRNKGDGVHRYIRIKEWVARQDNMYTVRVVLHEMVHIYFYQLGLTNISDGDKLFEWVCGRVMADISGVRENNNSFHQAIKPFLEEEGEWE